MIEAREDYAKVLCLVLGHDWHAYYVTTGGFAGHPPPHAKLRCKRCGKEETRRL